MSPCPSPVPPYRSWVEISLPQIAANFRAVRSVVGESVEVMPVVKADAYRHGAVRVSETLTQEGARWLAVSSVQEGVTLREAGIGARILVMADFLPVERHALLEHRLTPVIHTLSDIAAWDSLAAGRGSRAEYHLKIDSGMGRLGTRAPAPEICEAITGARNVDLEGIMTHFASAANYASPQTEAQIASFEKTCGELATLGVHPPFLHLSSTTPIAYGRKRAWREMVRPGHAIYGYTSPISKGHAPQRVLDVKPALTWKTQILAIKDIPEGGLVGYGGIFKALRPLRIAVLSAGYADGIPHRLSNRGKVIAGGKLAPIIGAVSMDLTTVDISDCPPLGVGDAVTLLGSEGEAHIDAQGIARTAGTISYSVLCGISARVKQIYV